MGLHKVHAYSDVAWRLHCIWPGCIISNQVPIQAQASLCSLSTYAFVMMMDSKRLEELSFEYLLKINSLNITCLFINWAFKLGYKSYIFVACLWLFII